MPINGNPTKTKAMPPKNAIEAFALCRWKKNLNVLSIPITQANPQMNNIFPIASSPLSNISKTPRNRNEMPKPANPTPISKMWVMKIDEILEIYVKSIELLTLYVCYLEHNCINCFILIFLKFKKVPRLVFCWCSK